jgi:AAA domain
MLHIPAKRRGEQAAFADDALDLEAEADDLSPDAEAPQPNLTVIKPWVEYRDPALLPRRDWLYGRHYLRGSVSATIADGGIGKSTLVLTEAIAMATGRNLLGVHVPKPVGVVYLSLEEGRDEVERRIAAICAHYGIDHRKELSGALTFQSGLDHPILAAKMEHGRIITEDLNSALKK